MFTIFLVNRKRSIVNVTKYLITYFYFSFRTFFQEFGNEVCRYVYDISRKVYEIYRKFFSFLNHNKIFYRCIFLEVVFHF